VHDSSLPPKRSLRFQCPNAGQHIQNYDDETR
jgi:hypothetical protein